MINCFDVVESCFQKAAPTLNEGKAMIELKLEPYSFEDKFNKSIAVPFHSSFHPTYKNLKRWLNRFSQFIDESLTSDLVLFYSLAKKKYLDHRSPMHLSRLVLSIYRIRKKLLSASSLFSPTRHLAIRWLPTNLFFPFSSKQVLGCLIGFNIMDRCELFDEENILVLLQKHFPDLQFVKESYYNHTSQNETIRICYFEIEKKDGIPLSLTERNVVMKSFKEKIKNSIQKLVPSMFIKLNQEEIYKNILILSQEITKTKDLPQVCITLDQHTGKEIIFHITLVQISPLHPFSLEKRISESLFVLERTIPVRHIEKHQIEALLLKLILPCEASLLRSDGSLDFYTARQKVTHLLTSTLGEFRDYNGGLLLKQQELLFSFKQNLLHYADQDSELMETFFHALVPLEKQALLDPAILSMLFTHFMNHRQEKMTEKLSFKIHHDLNKIFILVRSNDPSIINTINNVIYSTSSVTKNWAYNILETPGEFSFNCILLDTHSHQTESFILSLQEVLHDWNHKQQNQQVLRIALGHSMFSLDPRIGGESVSGEVLRLLFEGLTRFNEEGVVENALAESIKISPDLKQYTFKLRASFWNDGSPVSAHDFAYSWKRILAPGFKTNFATYFYPIKQAKKAKEGIVSPDQIGVHVIDDRTFQVDLEHPTPYFLELTTLSIFAPIHRLVDQERPQWPYQAGAYYPCNGPFQLKINQLNQAYQLVKNPLYWNSGQIELDQITLTLMDTFQAIQAFVKNEVDWIGNPFGDWHSTPNSNEGRTVYSLNSCCCYLVFNTSSPPFHHQKIRQAISLSIHRAALIQEVNRPWVPASSILFPNQCEKEHQTFPDYNKEEARQLLKEGLDELGLTHKDLQLQLIFPQKSILETAAPVLKKQLKEHLDIDCQLQSFPWNLFFQNMSEGQFQMSLLNWMTPIKDPIGTLNIFKFSKEGINFPRWEASEFQQLLDLSEKEINPLQRSSYLYQAEKVLAKEVPAIPLFYQPDQAIIRKNFQINYNQGFSGYFNQVNSFYKMRQ